jgi:hypothetical protein
MISDEQRSLIAEIAMADSLGESIATFSLTQDFLEGCKFIFASEKGSAPGKSVRFDFKDGSAIRSLFNTEKILVLDKETLKEMSFGNAKFQIDYSISLDTQALSYLEPYINGFENKLPNDFKDIFTFISRDDVFVDPMPYVHENYMNLNVPKAADRIFNKLKAYEVLRTLDKCALENESIVRSSCTEAELMKNTQEHIARMFTAMANAGFVNELNINFNYQYVHLLKMISIQLEKPNRSTYSKIIDFLDFCHEDVSSIGFREALIANGYFKIGQKLGFFSKIQKNKKDLFKVINGMAWDLYHIRQMERLATIRPNENAKYYFPSFLTCDKRLIDIIDLYPLKCFAYVEGDYEPIPFFDGDILKSLSGNLDEENEIYSKYFSSNKVNIRAANREVSRNELTELVKKLELELSQIANVELVR